MDVHLITKLRARLKALDNTKQSINHADPYRELRLKQLRDYEVQLGEALAEIINKEQGGERYEHA